MGASVGLNDLKQTAVIKNGDPIRIQLVGKDFQVSGEGVAQSDGMVNDMVKIRLSDGQMLQGRVVRAGVAVVNLE
jgi:flagella basal body P-ring formation protein FlgA